MTIAKYALAAVLCISASPLLASVHTVSVGDQLKFDTSTGYRQGSGGEFAISLTSPTSVPNYFHTFCAEIGENISDNQVATVQSLGLTTNASTPTNTLSYGAAKLYSDYFAGIAASNYGFGTGTNFVLGSGTNTVTFNLDGNAARKVDGANVQFALWALIGEQDSPAVLPGNLTGDALKLYNAYVGTGANASGDAYYSVRIANLVSSNGTKLQDQFVMVVPEPGTIAVWSVLGLIGLATIRKQIK